MGGETAADAAVSPVPCFASRRVGDQTDAWARLGKRFVANSVRM